MITPKNTEVNQANRSPIFCSRTHFHYLFQFLVCDTKINGMKATRQLDSRNNGKIVNMMGSPVSLPLHLSINVQFDHEKKAAGFLATGKGKGEKKVLNKSRIELTVQA